MKIIFIFLILFSFLLIPVSMAESSPEFIDFLTDTIIKDCGNVVYNGHQITRQELRDILIERDKHTPRSDIVLTDSIEGYTQIFECNNKSLRWHQDTYYWDNVKIDPFVYNLVIQTVNDVVNSTISQSASIEGNSQAVAGNNNIACQGDNCNAKSSNWFSNNGITIENIIFNIGLYFMLSISFYLIYKFFIKKHK